MFDQRLETLHILYPQDSFLLTAGCLSPVFIVFLSVKGVFLWHLGLEIKQS